MADASIEAESGADLAAVRAAAQAYCRALHEADVATLEQVFDPAFRMVAVGADATLMTWTRDAFLDRIRAREAASGAPDYEIFDLNLEGAEMAWVRLAVTVPPRRFHDYLGFLKVEGGWRIVNKHFRIVDGPAI